MCSALVCVCVSIIYIHCTTTLSGTYSTDLGMSMHSVHVRVIGVWARELTPGESESTKGYTKGHCLTKEQVNLSVWRDIHYCGNIVKLFESMLWHCFPNSYTWLVTKNRQKEHSFTWCLFWDCHFLQDMSGLRDINSVYTQPFLLKWCGSRKFTYACGQYTVTKVACSKMDWLSSKAYRLLSPVEPFLTKGLGWSAHPALFDSTLFSHVYFGQHKHCSLSCKHGR